MYIYIERCVCACVRAYQVVVIDDVVVVLFLLHASFKRVSYLLRSAKKNVRQYIYTRYQRQ